MEEKDKKEDAEGKMGKTVKESMVRRREKKGR